MLRARSGCHGGGRQISASIAFLFNTNMGGRTTYRPFLLFALVGDLFDWQTHEIHPSQNRTYVLIFTYAWFFICLPDSFIQPGPCSWNACRPSRLPLQMGAPSFGGICPACCSAAGTGNTVAGPEPFVFPFVFQKTNTPPIARPALPMQKTCSLIANYMVS